MATCEGLRQIFENPPLPENPPRMELSSFSELFGELHFKETLESSSLPFITSFQSPSPSQISMLNLYPKPDAPKPIENHKNLSVPLPLPSLSFLSPKKNKERSTLKQGFSSMNLESLHMCTEGLGFESFEDVDDGTSMEESKGKNEKNLGTMRRSASSSSFSETRKSRTFPPPIPSIGRNGKPWVSYKSFRCDGRLVLKEIMTPTHGQEFMHACREDGRLTLHLVHRDQEITKDEEIEDGGGCVEEEDQIVTGT
ncbi:hypothetical protein ACHQM5_013820 [Ranunculus cassubicifolius]